MEVIVLAGGRGTRLEGILSGRPKPMADIAGRPFLEYLLDLLLEQGVQRVILSVGYLAQVIQEHFGVAYKGIRISYAIEASPLGTGGAICNALKSATEDDVFVINGDTFMELNYGAMMAEHEATHASLTIAVRRVPDVSRYGAISTDEHGLIHGFGEKRLTGAGLINSGVYLLHKVLFESFALSDRFSMETDFVGTHLAELRPLAFQSDGYFIDIGIPSDLERAQRELPARCNR